MPGEGSNAAPFLGSDEALYVTAVALPVEPERWLNTLQEAQMSRIPPAPPQRYVPHFGSDATERLQVWAHAPEAAAAVDAVAATLQQHSVLSPRLVELIRLRVAYHNQCRTCMASRYSDARDAGVTEELVCSLEQPEDAPDLTTAERAALRLADRFATDHLSVTDEQFAELRRHFDDSELMELCFRLAYYVGFGRMMAILDVRPDELPERFRVNALMTPWGPGGVMERQTPQVVGSSVPSASPGGGLVQA